MTATSTYRIAGAQINIRIADAAFNLATMQRLTAAAVEGGARTVVFPECTLTGYCFDSREEALAVAQPLDSDCVAQVIAMAKQHQTQILFGFLELDATQGSAGGKPRIFNTIALVDDSGVLATYRKNHLPTLGVDQFTTPGEAVPTIVDHPDIRFGLNICYDCSFPESSRLLALAGADVILLPTNWPPGAGRVPDIIPNARALENNVYFLSVNRIGHERGFDFVGKSKFCDPLGGDVAFADHANEALIFGDVDVQWARKKHYVSVPGKHEVHRFRDRRPDLYSPLVQPTHDDGNR